jgi:ATP-dependent DNA ligase
LQLGGWDLSALSLIERKALLESLLVNKPAFNSM